MPVALSYPGVYVEEIPSAVHTITGVATSIAAFIGWAAQGPTDQAILVQSWSDYQNQFGGLDSRTNLGYAVYQFFGNGGQQAYIIRTVWSSSFTAATGTTPTAAATASDSGSPVFGSKAVLWASSPGAWANSVQVAFTPQTGGTGRFGLQVLGSGGQLLESYVNLSTTPTDPQYVVAVINNDSQYITFVNPSGAGTTPAPTAPATASTETLANGNDGTPLVPGTDGNFETALGLASPGAYGVHLLDDVDIFNLLCVPGETDTGTIQELQNYCATNLAFYIVDSPSPEVAPLSTVQNPKSGPPVPVGTTSAALATLQHDNYSSYSAYYYPWVQAPDPLFGNRPNYFPPCGFVAGIYASTDAGRGVWKAPAGTQAALTGVNGSSITINDSSNGLLNPAAINCIRTFNVYGTLVWGARTLDGADELGSQWKYVPVRRMALFLEASLLRGLKWAVFEPNDNPLWSSIRLNVTSFMQNLFLQGAFQGQTPQDAYFVKCDSETTTQADINLGIVNILVGFAPLQPAEFVVIQIQQLAGQLGT